MKQINGDWPWGRKKQQRKPANITMEVEIGRRLRRVRSIPSDGPPNNGPCLGWGPENFVSQQVKGPTNP